MTTPFLVNPGMTIPGATGEDRAERLALHCLIFLPSSDTEKIQIPKLYSPYGFRSVLDAPTSSAVRREDDKVPTKISHRCDFIKQGTQEPHERTPGW